MQWESCRIENFFHTKGDRFVCLLCVLFLIFRAVSVLTLFCATAQPSYCRLACARRPSSVVRQCVVRSVRKTRFLRNRQANQRHLFFGKATCPPYLQTIFLCVCVYVCVCVCVLFFKISILHLLWLLSSSHGNMGPNVMKFSKNISSDSTQQIQSQTNYAFS